MYDSLDHGRQGWYNSSSRGHKQWPTKISLAPWFSTLLSSRALDELSPTNEISCSLTKSTVSSKNSSKINNFAILLCDLAVLSFFPFT